MYLQYGNFQHPANEVEFSSITSHTEYSPRGYPMYTRTIWAYEGKLLASSQAALSAAMGVMQDAYDRPFQNATLFFDSGQASQHQLINAATIGGVRVSNFNWGPGKAGEYATYRSYNVVLEAMFQGDIALAEWEESIEITGTGGPRWIFLDVLEGEPQQQEVQEVTTVKCTQSGSSKSLDDWDINDPYFPDAEHEELRKIGRHSPVVAAGQQWQFPASWSYTFENIEGFSDAAPQTP